jgi:hypothetical protein
VVLKSSSAENAGAATKLSMVISEKTSNRLLAIAASSFNAHTIA